MAEPHIWITGAAGFLGSHVARRFRSAGWAVSGIDVVEPRTSDASLFAGWWSKGLSLEALEGLLGSGSPSCIFHAAGSGSVGRSFEDPEQDYRDSVVATEMMLGFIQDRDLNSSFVFPSSAAVYGACPPIPLVESRVPHPVSPYGENKFKAEEVCRRASVEDGIRTIIVRFFSLYGPGLRKQLLWDVGQKVLAAGDRVVLYGTGDETRDMLYVDDAAEIIYRLAVGQDRNHVLVNGGTGRALTVRQIAGMLVEALGSKARIEFNGADRPGDPKHYLADLTRARALGLGPFVSFDEQVKRYAEWLRETVEAAK